jgi:DUF1680 family protein
MRFTLARCSLALCALAVSLHSVLAAAGGSSRLEFESVPDAHCEFTGPVGERVHANIEQWLLTAPQANPGLLEMFRVRDRKPTPELVPWAGEFVGKYLISAIQALRMSEDPRLRSQVEEVLSRFIATQAEDGYLGPFPKRDRLLKHWDLWGHYHAIQALLMWHQRTGDASALAAARRAGDLVCNTYLGTGRRVFDAGDPEMNMAILTGMAMLYRLTGEDRYLRMAREVEKDWERAGDYLRSGLDGREYFRSPRPRWESLHDLQGLLEIWRITGEPRYRDAFGHHWRSIRRWDRRNTGGFSSGEQATGNPYTPSAIETCCTVAWMALTVDYLRLTGDPLAADDLELATLNGGLGAQHPSGRWWTYNTPMDGAREASAHTIVFQSRAGTPELNCCSVNAPRVLGGLGEWAVMRSADGIVVNSYLPAKYSLPGVAGPVVLMLDKPYPVEHRQRVFVVSGGSNEWTLRLRIPEWSSHTKVAPNFEWPIVDARPGTYVEIRRAWRACDEVVVAFDEGLRVVPGANEAAGKVSIYRGPLLLAFDQARNAFDEDAIPAVDVSKLAGARVLDGRKEIAEGDRLLMPWVTVDVPTSDGRPLRLVDFASAGASGTRYRSWLAAAPVPPPPAFTQLPADAAHLGIGPVTFRWRGGRAKDLGYRVEFSLRRDFSTIAHTVTTDALRVRVEAPVLQGIAVSGPAPIFWRVAVVQGGQESRPDVPAAWFLLDPAMPPQVVPEEPKPGPDGELVVHVLRGDAKPSFGVQLSGKDLAGDADGTAVNGRDQMLTYDVPAWPEEAFSMSVRVKILESQQKRPGQVFSAWAASMDDPLRVIYEGGKIFARIEAGGGFSTPGVPVESGRWYHVAAVKQGGSLKLYLDGHEVGACGAPELSMTQARDCALGGNPHYGGNEFLTAAFADFALHARALRTEEIAAAAKAPGGP